MAIMYKIWTFFKASTSKKATIWLLKKDNNAVVITFWKIMSTICHMEKKHSSKQVAPIIYTLEKKTFCSCCFLRFVSHLFSVRV